MRRRNHLSWARLALALSVCLWAGCSKESRKASHLKKGDSYFEAGQYESAEIEYLNALQLDPQNPPAIRRLGVIFYEQGRFQRAFAFLHKAAELTPNDAELRLKLAVIYRVGRQPAKAREEAVAVLNLNPAHPEAVPLLAELAVTSDEIKETRARLQRLHQQAGDKASFEVASGLLSFREKDNKSADASFRRALAMDPKAAPAYIGLGNIYWQTNDLAQADRLFKAAADLSPPRSGMRIQWADFKIRTGGSSEGRRFLEELVRQAPDYLPALKRLAELDLAEKKYEHCLTRVQKMLSLDAANYDAVLLRGQLHLAQGQNAQGAEVLEHLRTAYPRSAQAHYQLAIAYLVGQEQLKALGVLEQALRLEPEMTSAVLLMAELKTRTGDPASAVTLLGNLLKKQPRNAEALHLLAVAHRSRGALEDAVAVYRGLMEAFPKDPQAPLQLGVVLRQQKKPTEARQALAKAAELAPDSLAVLNELLELDVAEKNFAAAFQRVQQATVKSPKSGELKFLEAKVHLAKGDSSAAEAALEKAIQLDDTFRDAYVALARIYSGGGKNQPALQKLDGVISRNPKDVGALMMRGMVLENLGEFEKAKDSYEKLLAVRPQFGPALNNLAYLYGTRFGQSGKAVELARKARELLPNDPSTADTLGWMLSQRGDYTGALGLLLEGVAKFPQNAEVNFHLGTTYYMMGQEQAARAALQRAVSSGKDFPGKQEAQRRLAVLDLVGSRTSKEGAASLEKIVAEDPKDIVAWLRLAGIYEQAGAADKAKAACEKALGLNLKSAQATVLLAKLYSQRLGDPQKALELARTSRTLAPEDPEVAHIAGRIAYLAGDHAWAFSLLQDSARKLSAQPEVLYDLAWASYSMGRLTEADESMRSALRLEAPFARAESARRFLAMTALAQAPAEIAGAASQIEAVLKVEPDHVPALMVSAMGDEQRGRVAEARKVYETLLRRWPQFAPAMKQLAVLFSDRLKDDQAAYDLAVKARQTLAQDRDLAGILGKLVYRRGDFGYAVQLLKEATAKGGADPEVYYYLGLAHYKLKQKADGQAALQQALNLRLDSALANEARRVLAENR